MLHQKHVSPSSDAPKNSAKTKVHHSTSSSTPEQISQENHNM